MRQRFSHSFEVLSGELEARQALRRVSASRKDWVVVAIPGAIRGRPRYYVLSSVDLHFALDLLGLSHSSVLQLLSALGPLSEARVFLPGEPLRWHEVAGELALVRLNAALEPAAVAGSALFGDLESLATGAAESGFEAETPSDPPFAKMEIVRQPESAEYAFADDTQAKTKGDEGSAPIRHPSIKAESSLRPGEAVVLLVDLLYEPDTSTEGGAMSLAPQPDNWTSLPVGVTLVSAGIDFEGEGRGIILVQRNKSSLAARIEGRLQAQLGRGDLFQVHAQFWDGSRCIGSAVRTFTVGRKHENPTTVGLVGAQLSARKPDLTVYITLFDASAPGKMHWRLVTDPFDGLPGRLAGVIDLGHSPRDEANQMFRQFANLAPGEHTGVIEAFGERLWQKSPPEFKEAYWALHAHYGRALTIQFISDDPHLPWELMKPDSAGESHPPLAERHAVARWIGAYQGYLRNTLPGGDMIVVAPRYQSVSTARPRTEQAAQALQKEYGALQLAGTREELIKLLREPPHKPVALLYFSGHGAFDPESPLSSSIKLEGGKQLAASEVRHSAVELGKQYGTVVFFNSCEVGATAAAFGEVGGWADAFAARHFRAFIAPLWAVDEEDAILVSEELIGKLVRDRMPIGSALQQIRQAHGAKSPSFHAYLAYGDVTACFDAGIASASAG